MPAPLIEGYGDSILLIVRFVLGISMIYYGIPKIADLKANAEDFVKMGFKPGWLWGTIVATLEFFGGISVLIGFAAGLVGFLYAFEMFMGTIWKTNRGKPFTDWSYDLQLLALGLVVGVFGPGSYALFVLF